MTKQQTKIKCMAEIIESRLSRRQILQVGVGTLLASSIPSVFSQTKATLLLAGLDVKGLLGFKAIAVANLIDDVIVPEGYRSEVFYRWGDPISTGPEFKMDASNTADEQLQQAGMHHDAMQFYPLSSDQHGLLVMNHEYIDGQLLHRDGGVLDSVDNYTMEKTLKEQYAHGVSVIEVEKKVDGWQIIRPSAYARRITAVTPMSVSGPVAGTVYIQTQADPQGREILGTFNNCSNGKTPWGTYLTCEENVNGYFDLPTDINLTDKQKKAFKRYGIKYSYYGWHHHDQRFDASQHPNEVNRFGWIVEFDPLEVNSKPIKRTALGRFFHENVAHKVAQSKQIAFYSGDDSQFEYVYKFITTESWDGSQGMKNGRLLDEGVLYVARFNEDGSGDWLPLIYGQAGLTEENGFVDQADILVHTRLAADKLGATAMDRPEWITVQPDSQDIYVSMTNNSRRGDEEQPSIDAANPRKNNHFGHIIKMRELDATSLDFNWDIFVLAGDELSQATIKGDLYANPDGLMFDSRGVLWMQTDVSASKLNTGDFTPFGNNQMLAVDPNSGETRRFLTGPIGCEITGVVMTPDLKTMWVNIQHPGEVPKILKQQGIKKSPLVPNAASNWPDQQSHGRPRSATVLITKDDGGVIGS